MKNHLIDIERTSDNKTQLTFNNYKYPRELTEISGFEFMQNTKAVFADSYTPVFNKDAISVMDSIKDLLKTQKKVSKTPAEYYEELMGLTLTVGEVYSSYVEMLFAHMFLTDVDNREFWRYNQSDPIVTKLGDKVLASYLSKLLDLLYRPNKSSIENVDFDDLNLDALTIYEKIYVGDL